MSLDRGTRIGPYEVLSPLGAGGMGEVYRARDSRLDRDVALKLLPQAIAGDPQRAARFQREAQVLAALNHAHIAQIYGFEDSPAGTALVMELVDGPTLADRLERGAVPLGEALDIGRQIAEALEAAHDKGIVHRDLKPGNVMITSAGVVKVLDFGLAGVTRSTEPSIDVTQSPTLTIAATQAGMILGTAAYMSPEQAAGKPVDKRADIWSFGVVLWELLTGRRLFEGETIPHTLADVLRAPIELSGLPATTPPAVRELLRRCLDRDPRTRLRDIGEARIALQNPPAAPAEANGDAARIATRLSRWRRAAWAAGVAAVSMAALALFFRNSAPPEVRPPVRFELQAPEGTTFSNGAAVSPDGRMIAFEAPGADGRSRLWVRPLDSLEARALPGTEDAAAGAFWSPDNQHLGFGVGTVPRRLKRVDLVGGAPQTLAELPAFYRHGAWNRDGDILYGVAGSGLWRVRATGGEPVQVTIVDPSRRESQHSEPVFLPDGRRFLYHRTSANEEHHGIFIGSLDVKPEDQSVERLVESASGAAFVPAQNGVILFRRENTLLAQRFDGTRLIGDPIRVVENVGASFTMGWFSASPTGTLVYRAGRSGEATADLVWFDRSGKRAGQVGPGAPYENTLQVSPDGRHVVAVRADASLATRNVSPDGRLTLQTSGSRIWIAETARGVFGPLVSDTGAQSSPVISADGRIAYTSTAHGAIGDLYVVPANGIGAPEPLIVKANTPKHANDFSPDGRYLIYDDHHATQRQDLFVLPLQADAAGERKPIPFVVTPADETLAQFSPDGRWVAYSSDETGRREVYVQGFAPDRVPATAVGKWTISAAGGDKPRWSADGLELFYLSPDRKLIAVPIKSGPTFFEPGVAVPLFDAPVLGGFVPFDVGRDGRFLMNVVADTATARATPLTVVLNWRPEFR
jgi:Tol biopolymer transport system component